jgi:hypothetical protein
MALTKTLAQRALEIALTQNGIEEVPRGSNGGADVNVYLRSVGLGAGFAWCMAFVYWCVNKAAGEMGIKNPLVKTAGVMMQWNSTQLRKLPNRSSGIKAGDIFIMEFAGGNGHTGFVVKVENGIVYTIEGNTNDDGSREGYEVAKRQRPISTFKGFIQLS